MITTTFSNYILNKLFAQSATNPDWPSGACYLGLSTSEPDASGNNFTEPATLGTGYKRINIKDLMSPANEQSITNHTEIHFLEAQTNWGLIKYFGIFAASSGSVPPIFWGAINEENGEVLGAEVNAGNVAIIPAEQLTVTLT